MLKLVSPFWLLLLMAWVADASIEDRYKFASNIFFEVVAMKPNENVMLSPASLHTCLALTYMGAEGHTAEVLRKGAYLEYYKDKQAVAEDFGELLSGFTHTGKNNTASDSEEDNRGILSMANRVFVNNDIKVQKEFNTMAKKYFHSKATTVNFADNTATARRINHWVENKTNNKIKNLVDAQTLNQDTALLLVNAIYFKAQWRYKFDKHYTREQDFHVSATNAKPVQMMFRPDTPALYGEVPELDAVALELTYARSPLRMLVVLPKAVDGLADMEQKLNSTFNLVEVFKTLKQARIDVRLPLFKIEFGDSLVKAFSNLGMGDLFNGDADFSTMLKASKPLYVSDLKHKTFIDVNEQGTEAAGATYVQVQSRIGRLHPLTFNADHPFLFAIVDEHAVYFMGHVVDV